ncbi:hypothetical protein QBC44DRAFT_369900 [Cladorrhinum sp. PSN332]|nr:hypothetical protein QBC44DRAFT_369900 [Cladorrhinum sp. PSN332]
MANTSPSSFTPTKASESKTSTSTMLDRFVNQSTFDEPTVYGRAIYQPSKPDPFSRLPTYGSNASKKLADFESVFSRPN